MNFSESSSENLRELPLPQLVTCAQASAYLGKSEYTIRQMLKDGKLKGSRCGATWLIRVIDLRRFVTPFGEADDEF